MWLAATTKLPIFKMRMADQGVDIDRVVRHSFVARAEHHATLASTNDRAVRCATQRPGELPLLIVADRQTAGRGRGTNRWWTGPGSLAFSLLLDPCPSAGDRRSQSPLVALAAAVAIAETVGPLLPSETVGIHWPNDVMAAGRKLAGVLVEVLADGRAVVGIGINTNCTLADAPSELRQTATTLLELTGRQHDQTAILVDLLGRFERGLAQLGSEPERIGARADALCLQRGKTLTIQLGNRLTAGRCAGIAADGALLLDTPEGRRTFHSGMLLP